MVEHYAAGEGQGEEAPKVTFCTKATCLPPSFVLHIPRCHMPLEEFCHRQDGLCGTWSTCSIAAMLCILFW